MWSDQTVEITTKRGGKVSYLKDLPCETCGTKIIYAFPNWPNVRYCYCSFRDEIGEQIAREILENFNGGHTKGENDCSCEEGSDPCYYCGAKDYT